MNGTRKLLSVACLVFVPLAAPAVAAPAIAATAAGPGLAGNWARDDGTTHISISPCGAALCAVNTWVKDPNGKEKIGDKLLLTLKPVSSSELQGPAFDERRQMHYKMTITLNGNQMRTSGCVFLGILCKSAGWTRIN